MVRAHFHVPATWPMHPRTMRLRSVCGEGGPWGLLRLWSFAALDGRDDGDLSDMDDDDIEAIADWHGNPGLLAEALDETGFVVTEPGGAKSLVGWPFEDAR